MASVPMVAIELSIPPVTAGPPDLLYLATHSYTTLSSDTPASTWFEPRISSTLTIERAVDCVFWGGQPRGRQGFGVVRLANADGRFDSLVGRSMRDATVTIKRGQTDAAFATFVTVAVLIVDRAEFEDERALVLYLKDQSAKLERALQLALYSSSVTNQALRGRPRPITIGACYQIPLAQPDVFGNGRFDVHDDDNWIGVTQLLDQGAAMVEGTAYRRAVTPGIFGIERTNGIGGQQVASVEGAFKVVETLLSDDFTSLAAWTETNGGAPGRDASIVGNQLRMLNTAGGAALILTSVAAIAAVASDVLFYEFDVTHTSGQAQMRVGSASNVAERIIDSSGRYTGVMRSASAFNLVFRAEDGSNCDLTIDSLRVRRVRLIERLDDVIEYVAVTKGPLSAGDLDATALSSLSTDAPLRIGFHASDSVQIADVLDQVMASFGGWWSINRLGKLTAGRLLSPSGSPAYTFDTTSIAAGMSIRLDAAPGLSNVVLSGRNWSPLPEQAVVPALNSVALSATDKDSDVTLSGANYAYTTAGAGSVRSTPGIFGERYYFEVRISTLSGDTQHYVGVGSPAAAIGNYPGADANALGYRANGDWETDGFAQPLGTAWAANDVIGVAIDARPAAQGARAQHFRVWFRRNGTWQGSGSPDSGTGFVKPNAGVTGVANAMIGVNTASANAGTANFGQSTFAHAPPSGYIAPAWHRQTVMSEYRFRYQSPSAISDSYAHADAYGGVTLRRQVPAGIPTVISSPSDAQSECDRWTALYAVDRFFYEFDGLLPAGVSVDQIEPGQVISVTYPRFGLAAKLLRVVGIKGDILGRSARITAWG